MPGHGLKSVGQDVLEELGAYDKLGSSLRRNLIREFASREVYDPDEDEERLDDLLARFVTESLEELRTEYQSLFDLFWPEGDVADEEFSAHLKKFQELVLDGDMDTSHGTGDDAVSAEAEPAERAIWPYPIQAPARRLSAGGGLEFLNEQSAMKICGYTVGKTKGMPAEERKEFLEYFLRNDLPAEVDSPMREEWGAPSSVIRLQKMVDHLAGQASLPRNKSADFSQAIRDWEADLEFLRDRYGAAEGIRW